MAEIRSNRAKRNHNIQHKTEKLNIQLDIETLSMMCRFVISDSTYIKRFDLAQLRRFLNILDTQAMSIMSPDIRDRILYIQYGLEARLDKKLVNHNAILGYISNKFTKDIDFIDPNKLISKEDINWVNETISETLQYKFIYDAIPRMRTLCNDFMQTSIGHRGEIVPEFKEFVKILRNQFREVEVQDTGNTVFSLIGDNFTNQVTDTFNKVKRPSRRLWTGMQGFNKLIGGFEETRVYMLFGSSGVGKSITLLNIFWQLKKYNTNYKTKDPTKIPTVVLLTMENSVTETITRFFDLVSNNPMPMWKYDNVDEIIRILREEGQLSVSNDSPINLLIKYKPNHSVDTDYLYKLYDDLSDEGMEMICLIQDHVKRIRSIENENELRIELGNIVNEFKVFATEKEIPVISDSHINRTGDIMLDNATRHGKMDVTKMLGKGNVGESSMMIENLDMAIFINKEFDREGNMYMAFSSVKMRDAQQIPYIVHPFDNPSKIRLIEDVGLPTPMYKTTLKSGNDLLGPGLPGMVQNTYSQNIPMVPGYENEDSLFNDGTLNKLNEEAKVPKINIDNFVPLSSDIPKILTEKEKYMLLEKRTGLKNPFIFYEDDKNMNNEMNEISNILNNNAE